MRWGLLLTLFCCISLFETNPLNGLGKDAWVTETLSRLSLDDKIAQLMMVEVRPSKGRNHLDKVDSLVGKYKVGGIIFFKTDPQNLFLSAQKYQSMAEVPLLVGIDGEWGVSMRVDNTIQYPYQIGLGGIQDERLIYKMGRDIGKQCKRLGIHINFAPVIDVNNNPDNPVINFRSFGEDPMNVARKGWKYAKGMQDEGIIACAKHFPGHGDTKTDSHKDLPVIKHDRMRLDAIELKPFRYLIDSGVMSIMTAHVYMPGIDTTANLAISLSPLAINGLLKKDLHFRGLAITDALDMQGVSKDYQSGILELKALMAGNDILLCPADVPRAIDTIRAAVLDGRFSLAELDAKVKKVLQAKAFAGLDVMANQYYSDLVKDLNNSDALKLYHQLVENEICVAKDDFSCIPLFKKPYKSMAVIALGGNGPTGFERKMKALGSCDIFSVDKLFGVAYCTNMVSKLEHYDHVIVAVHHINKYPKDNYGITADLCSLVSQLKEKTKVTMVCFGNPYSMRNFTGLSSTVFAFGDDEAYYNAAANALWGINKIDAKLSVSVGDEYAVSDGKTIAKSDVLLPFDHTSVAVNTANKLSKINEIVKQAINAKATPGCQVLVAQHGKVIFNQSYGFHTYEKKTEVKNSNLYDLASITKLASTSLAIMKLVELKQINLNDTLSMYLPELDESEMQNITIREILVHESGLKDFIPFYKTFASNDQLRDSIVSKVRTPLFDSEIGEELFVNKHYQKRMLSQIAHSPLGEKGKYVYSDLGMIMLRIMIERLTNTSFETYLDENFYKPMGLKTLTFNPLHKFNKNEIVPTEKDPDFRKGMLRGYVHDPSAALLGGVSGHAGLFSNASDLAEIGQMLMNYGFYNGKRILQPSTILEFTKRQNSQSRRGLGFDKPENTSGKTSPASKYSSNQAYGHTGFTGTCIWMDPQNGLVYVFLSNRVCPSADNRTLITKNVRTEIMDVIYETLK